MKTTEQNIIKETKTGNELNDVVGGTTCFCSAQSFPNGTEAQIPSSADLAVNQAMILAKQNLLQQAAQDMLALANQQKEDGLKFLQ